MNAEQRPAVAADNPGGEGLDSAHAWSHRDHAPQPAHILGPKASRLRTRRLRADAARGPRPTDEAVTLSTADAALSFTLKAVDANLYVERTQRWPLGTHVTQCMIFAVLHDYLRWCEAEPLRFDDPVLHQRLVRLGREHFDAGR